jgi:hypothetical protein
MRFAGVSAGEAIGRRSVHCERQVLIEPASPRIISK